METIHNDRIETTEKNHADELLKLRKELNDNFDTKYDELEQQYMMELKKTIESKHHEWMEEEHRREQEKQLLWEQELKHKLDLKEKEWIEILESKKVSQYRLLTSSNLP
jgi:hypothetical protein